MPSWSDIVNEINVTADQFTMVRRKYIDALHNNTKRNVIAYYSAFLTKSGTGLSIDDSDMTGFMTSVQKMDRSLGLDLILHTPGGNPMAAEQIVYYLRSVFNNDIRVIVPQLAMSAGTMIACAANKIVMGRQSSLGPIDPQLNGMAAFNIKEVFDEAKRDLAGNPQNATYWAIQFQQYSPALLYDCINSIELSSELVKKWLVSGMFSGRSDAEERAESVTAYLNQNADSKNHGRHFDISKCKGIGLIIDEMENDNVFQDIVLSVHHSYTQLMQSSSVIKIIENHLSKAYVVQGNALPVQ